jgi:DNA repair protein RadC
MRKNSLKPWANFEVRVQLIPEKCFTKGPKIRGAKGILKLVGDTLRLADREMLMTILLDSQMRILGIKKVAIGSDGMVVMCPKAVYKASLLTNATQVILLHNHPGGKDRPSPADVKIARRMHKIELLLDVELWDFIIVGEGYTSFREKRISPFK